jgi:hypothetical protein
MGGWLVVCLLLAGCATGEHSAGQPQPKSRPENVFVYSAVLPASLQRVAVLPVACEEAGPVSPDSCEALGPVLLDELTRTKKFEVVSVSPEILRRRTGRADWTGAETLPADFFGVLQRQYGCDAVLFCELTTFRAYAPLTIGWRLKMVDAHTRQIIWAADEVVEASRRTGNFQQWWQDMTPESADEWAMQNSPARFGRYAAARLLETLPER